MTETRKLPDGSSIKFARVWRMVAKTETAELELDRKVRELMAATRRSYAEAMSVVLNLDGELKRRWVAETRK
jgi:hypothetical protein